MTAFAATANVSTAVGAGGAPRPLAGGRARASYGRTSTTAHAFETDLRDPIATHATVRQAIEALGGEVDVLVNNLRPRPRDLAEQLGLVLDVNRGHAASPARPRCLRRADGAMITLSLIDLRRASGRHHPHTISKYAMTMTDDAARGIERPRSGRADGRHRGDGPPGGRAGGLQPRPRSRRRRGGRPAALGRPPRGCDRRDVPTTRSTYHARVEAPLDSSSTAGIR